MKFLGTTTGNLTQNNDYEIIWWCYPGGSAISDLVLDDNGSLFVGQNMQDPLVWQIIRI